MLNYYLHYVMSLYGNLMKKSLIITIITLGSLLTSLVHSAENLSIERIFSAPALYGTTPRLVQLSPDGQRVTFIRAKQTDTNRFDLWEYNIKEQRSRLLFDADDLHQGDENLSDEEKARRERMRLSGSGSSLINGLPMVKHCFFR